MFFTFTGKGHWAEGALLTADSGGTRISGAQTRKAAVWEGQNDIGTWAVHRQPACARHRREAKYSLVPELPKKIYLGGFTADV